MFEFHLYKSHLLSPASKRKRMSSSMLVQDWKYPRTAKGFTGTRERNVSCTVLRCVTNSRIPCTAMESAAMGKTRFTLTVLGVGSVGFAFAPFKKSTGNKKIPKDPNAKPLFEVIRDGDAVTGVRMSAFKKAKSSFDRDEIDPGVQAEICIGQVFVFDFGFETVLSRMLSHSSR